MLFFPNAKINLGLKVLRKRPDGYHDLATVMAPVGWCDVLEMTPATGNEGSFTLAGKKLDCPPQKNLVIKALIMLESEIGHKLPPLDIVLEKHIPSGAGLGGGSADATFALIGANKIFNLGLSDERLAAIAAKVGADCAFFVYNKPMFATGIGEKLTPADLSQLNNYGILIAKPNAQDVSTAEAYAHVPKAEIGDETTLANALTEDISNWSNNTLITNDFEKSIFPMRPEISAIKERMKQAGALYTSMSGSGAAVYGIFASVKLAEDATGAFGDCAVFAGKALYQP